MFQQTEMNVDTGEPLDELSPESKKWAKALGSKAKTLSEVLETQDPQVIKLYSVLSQHGHQIIKFEIFVLPYRY